MKEFKVNDEVILVVNQNNKLRAVSGICTHRSFHLARGILRENSIVCTLHLSEFDLDTGKPNNPPATAPLKVYNLIIDGNDVYITL